jgi:PAS domain S-box-containing protein
MAEFLPESPGSVLFADQIAAEMFGYTQAEMQAKRLLDLMPERYHAMHLQGVSHYLATGEGPVLGKPLQVVGIRKDGREFPLLLQIDHNLSVLRQPLTARVRDLSV